MSELRNINIVENGTSEIGRTLDIILDSNKTHKTATPVASDDCANKDYVDNNGGGNVTASTNLATDTVVIGKNDDDSIQTTDSLSGQTLEIFPARGYQFDPSYPMFDNNNASAVVYNRSNVGFNQSEFIQANQNNNTVISRNFISNYRKNTPIEDLVVTNVVDSGGVARFEFDGSIYSFTVGRIVTISGYITNVAYNVTTVITAVNPEISGAGVGYIETGVAFGTDEVGLGRIADSEYYGGISINHSDGNVGIGKEKGDYALDVSGDIALSGNLIQPRVEFNSTIDTEILGNALIFAYTGLGLDTLTINSATIALGSPGQIFEFLVKDESGVLLNNPLFIVTESGATIEGFASQSIAKAYGYIKFYSNGTDVFISDSDKESPIKQKVAAHSLALTSITATLPVAVVYDYNPILPPADFANIVNVTGRVNIDKTNVSDYDFTSILGKEQAGNNIASLVFCLSLNGAYNQDFSDLAKQTVQVGDHSLFTKNIPNVYTETGDILELCVYRKTSDGSNIQLFSVLDDIFNRNSASVKTEITLGHLIPDPFFLWKYRQAFTIGSLPSTAGLRGSVVTNTGRFVTVGDAIPGSIGQIVSTTDADLLVWDNLYPGADLLYDLYSVADSGSITLITGQSHYRSTDGGAIWVNQTGAISVVGRGIIWTSSTFVIVGLSGDIETTTDGITYTARTSQTGNDLLAIEHNGAGLIMAIGASGVVTTSSDNGVTWVLGGTIAGGTDMSGLAYNSNLDEWVAVGAGGTIAISDDDGVTWVTQTSITGVALNDISYRNGVPSVRLLVAVGASNTIVYSQDGGVSWFNSPAPAPATGVTFNAVDRGGGQFMMGGAVSPVSGLGTLITAIEP